MKIIEVNTSPSADQEPLVLAVGKFDGIHRGHEAILQVAGKHAEKEGRLAVFNFSAHLSPGNGYKEEITPEADKIRLLKKYGVSRYYRASFIENDAETTIEEFIQKQLGKLNVKRIITGEGFRFGKEGTIELDALCRQLGIAVTTVPPVKANNQKISSRMIRKTIKNGAMEAAQSLLGRPYTITGPVVHGEKLGRQLGFPTANLGETDGFVFPKAGVYLGIAGIYQDGILQEYWHTLVNAGYRPAVNGKGYLIEANLLDFSGDLYGKTLAVSFLHLLREELDFPDLDSLVEQMKKDKEKAEKLLTGSH